MSSTVSVPWNLFIRIIKGIIYRGKVGLTNSMFKGHRKELYKLMFTDFYDHETRREIKMDKPLLIIGAAISVLGGYLLIDGLIFYKGFTSHVVIDMLLILIGLAVIRLGFRYGPKPKDNEENKVLNDKTKALLEKRMKDVEKGNTISSEELKEKLFTNGKEEINETKV